MEYNKCRYCEFCIPDSDNGFVCADKFYGESVKDSLEEIKECYSEGLEAFIARSEKEVVPMINTTLKQMKLDGRKNIVIKDQEGKSIRLKVSKAKELMPDIKIIKMLFEGEYEADVVFNSEPFNGGNYLVIQ